MKRNDQLAGPPSPPSKRPKIEIPSSGPNAKRNDQLAGPPPPPSKRPKIEIPSSGPDTKACNAPGTSKGSLANQKPPVFILETPETNKDGLQVEATGDSQPFESQRENITNLNQPQPVLNQKRNDQLAGPPPPPSKRPKIEIPSSGPDTKACNAPGTSKGSLANQKPPVFILETPETNKDGLQVEATGDSQPFDSHRENITNLNQPQPVLNQKCARKVRRRDLIDFFLREKEAGSCKDLLTFLGDVELLQTVIVPGAVSDCYKDHTKPSDVLKLVIHKVSKFVSDLQLSGWSFCGKADISDFLVTPLGDIRMRISKARSLKLQSSRRNRKDFRFLFRMLMKVLQGLERIPEDLLHLLKLMQNFSESDRVLITHSPATMTEQDRLSLLDKLYRSFEALLENDDRLQTIIAGVPYGNKAEIDHFLQRAKSNLYLVGMLEHKNPLWLSVPVQKKERPTYPGTGRGVLKLNRNSVQHAYKGLGTEKVDPGDVLEDNGQDKDDETDKESKGKKKKKKKKRLARRKRLKLVKPIILEKFKPMQVDHILAKTFPGLLCAFAKLMNDAGLFEEVIQELLLPTQVDPCSSNLLQALVLPATEDPCSSDPSQALVLEAT